MATEHTYDNGDKYVGEMVNGKRQGQGTYTDTEGHNFTGTWVQDGLTGTGKYKGDDGEYEGDWRDSLKHGKGVFVWVNGEKYEGDWLDDNMNGQGTFAWTNGKRYEGSWEDGLRNGYGKLDFPNGAQYEGDWVNDMCQGNGKYTEQAGVYEGQWEENKKHGRGVYSYKDGRKYDGQWVYDKKTEGLVYTPEGTAFQVKFADNGDIVTQTELNPAPPPQPAPAPKTQPRQVTSSLAERVAAFGGAGGAAPVAKKEPEGYNYKKSIPYADLKLPSKHKRPEIDVANREKYLSDAEFQQLFRMDKATFEMLPQWKKNSKKKALQLF